VLETYGGHRPLRTFLRIADLRSGRFPRSLGDLPNTAYFLLKMIAEITRPAANRAHPTTKLVPKLRRVCEVTSVRL
jgi:hypothetical protein